jgi:hypothetical protein
MGDHRDRDDRERLSWSEIDKLRDRPRSPRADRPGGRQAQQQAEKRTREALRAAETAFTSEKGGATGAALAKAVRDSHGTPDLEQACRDYVAAIGVPTSVDLLSIFLDSRQPDLIVFALEALTEQKRAGTLEISGGLKSQLRILAHEPDDDIAGLAEDLLE